MGAHPRSPALASLLALGITACGGSTTAGTTPTPSTATPLGSLIPPAQPFGDACRLLTAAEVQKAFGDGTVSAASQSDQQIGSTCTYESGGLLFKIQAVVENSASDARDAVVQLGGNPVSGVGDVARYAQSSLGTVLGLTHGPTLVVLSTSKNATQQLLVGLATTLVGRL